MKSYLQIASIVLLFTLFASSFVLAAGNPQTIKVGKTGDIVFSEKTIVGDVTLVPGHYYMKHEVIGSDHFVNFVQQKHVNQHDLTSHMMGAAHPGMTKCALEPLSKKAQQTAVTIDTAGGAQRITRIEIAGENVAHLF
jgi:hypothetical protein